jgi:hypothetical protein
MPPVVRATGFWYASSSGEVFREVSGGLRVAEMKPAPAASGSET